MTVSINVFAHCIISLFAMDLLVIYKDLNIAQESRVIIAPRWRIWRPTLIRVHNIGIESRSHGYWWISDHAKGISWWTLIEMTRRTKREQLGEASDTVQGYLVLMTMKCWLTVKLYKVRYLIPWLMHGAPLSHLIRLRATRCTFESSGYHWSFKWRLLLLILFLLLLVLDVK